MLGFKGLSATAVGVLVVTPLTLYSVGMIHKDRLKKSMFNAGFVVSQKFKKIPFWDKYIEPAFVKNFATFVIVGNALLEGMVSDNEQDSADIMQKMREEIQQDLEELEKAEDKKVATEKLSTKIKTFMDLESNF